MTRRLAFLALHLYPLAFKRRYDEEMRALLEQTEPRARTVLDLLRGALLAHVRSEHACERDDRLRVGASGVLACWVVFAAAGFAYYKTTEDEPFTRAGNAHALLGVAHGSIQALAVLGSLAVILGAAPLVFAALAQARRGEGRLRLLVCIPPAAVAVFACLSALLLWLTHSQGHATTVGHGAFVAWELAGSLCGALCVVGARLALMRTAVTHGRLVLAFACGVVVSVAMAGIALLVALYTIALGLDASALAASTNGPLALTSTEFSLIVQLVAMTVAMLLALTSTNRSWRALRSSPA
jgi:hypothetical protein